MFAPNEKKPHHEQESESKPHSGHEQPAPWVAAEELQPPMRPISPLDEVDECLIDSFPCSDPPTYCHAHA